MSEETLINDIALNLLKRVGFRHLLKIRQHYKDDIAALFSMSQKELEIKRFPPSLIEELMQRKDLLGEAQLEFERAQSAGICIINIDHDDYPKLLREISDPPIVLYVKGRLKSLLSVGVVGTRKATPYGLEATTYLARGLATAGVTVISGLARGIDRRAHEAALEVHGHTMAVVGNGLHQVYPKEHRKLQAHIGEIGAVISEFPLDAFPDKRTFPRRNRIISGLSQGVLVVEAPKKSGALITAEFALEEGREVFCVPGKINSRNAHGTNHLIQNGAHLVTSAKSVIEVLDRSFLKEDLTHPHQIVQSLEAEEKKILGLLSDVHEFGQLVEKSQLQPSDLAGMLLAFEMKGWIHQKNDQYFRKRLWQNH